MDAFVFERFGHITLRDPLSKPFGDGRLAYAGLTNQDRVVLGPAREDLDDAADLLLTTDDRVELALARQGGEIARVLLQRLELGLRRGVGHTGRTTNLGERLEDLLARDAGPLQSPGAFAVRFVDDGEQQVLGREVLVLEPLHLRRGGVEQPAKAGAEVGFGTVDLRQPIELRLEVSRDATRIDADLLQDRWNSAVLLLEQGQEQVLGRDFLVLSLLGKRLRLLDCLLVLFG